jgi:hypothetical protein
MLHKLMFRSLMFQSLMFRSLITVGLGALTVCAVTPDARADRPLSRGEVYKMNNSVRYLPQGKQARNAQIGDVLVPMDGVGTGSRSRAEVIFNEGSIARVGSNAIFRFKPGLRSFHLRHGTALILSPTQTIASATRIELPDADIEAFGMGGGDGINDQMGLLAMVDASKPEATETRILMLTNGTLKVSPKVGPPFQITGGDYVVMQNGKVISVTKVNLATFYQSSALALGLGAGDRHLNVIKSEIQSVQDTFFLIRPSTLAVLQRQEQILAGKLPIEGLCTVNARGSFSTASTNCITTTVNDPLTAYQNWRDVTGIIPEPPTSQQPTNNNNNFPNPQTNNNSNNTQGNTFNTQGKP